MNNILSAESCKGLLEVWTSLATRDRARAGVGFLPTQDKLGHIVAATTTVLTVVYTRRVWK